MSGNPFRRVVAISTTGPAAAAPSEPAASPQPQPDRSNVTPTRPRAESKTKKTVRIRSPEFSPIAPDYIRTSPLPDYRHAVPVPSSGALRSSSTTPPEVPGETLVDSFETRFPPAPGLSLDGENVQVLHNTQRNSGNREVQEQSKVAGLGNPFSSTLASMEAGIASVLPQPPDTLQLAKLDDALPLKAAKPAMDVDAFTRMLMTGRTEHSKPSDAGQVGGSVGSSDDTASPASSRHTLADTLQRPGAATQATPLDTSAVDGDSASPMPDSGEAGPTRTPKKAPPPPKHRHGKSVSSKGPQTVSFDDFTASLTQALPASTPKHSLTDLSQPDTPPHESSTSDPAAAADPHRPEVPTYIEPTEAPTRSTSQKKAPPPVPLARRQSQMKTQSHTRSRSNSALTTGSQEGSSYPPSIAESTGSSKVPPPPPPARRHGNPLSAPAAADPSHSSGSRSALAQALASSQQSTPSNISSSPPAPPPPRRRRFSGRNSFETGRLSGEFGRGSFDSTRRSMESSHALETPMEEVPQSDVLADMDAFQREIDELRKAQTKD